jgi:hypothetical protein
LTILSNEGIKSKVIDRIKENVYQYSDWDGVPVFIYGALEEEISCIGEDIIEKPYRKWMAKEKA